MTTRSKILVRGIVQGVGFRPYIFSLASRRALKGHVLNNSLGVVIDIEGDLSAIEKFVDEIRLNPPPLSEIESVERSEDLTPLNYTDFRIAESDTTGERIVPISADTATCEDCLRELFDIEDRRYRYPFINCTNCGPRFTIIENIPYDRARTTMSDFEMCNACRAEYQDPIDRRFHAEPTACPKCGPRVFLTDSQFKEVTIDYNNHRDAISLAQELLLGGSILAIKGLGGFHLACDATDNEAVKRLRSRKYREEKPFALMARSVDVIKEHCFVSHMEENLLLSDRRSIVLLARKPNSEISDAVAPGVKNFGFMLPYTPLHHLLLENLDQPIVITSGNMSDEPICYSDEDATQRLSNIADYFLLHNRRIHMRADDSVARIFDGREMLLRRSRGYAPAPIRTIFESAREILACGAELKNTFCLLRGGHAFVSHHIGDLENLETLRSFTTSIEHYKRLFNLAPEIVAYDLHPEYLSTKYALACDQIETKIAIQHHHAHIASCMADNMIEGEVIGIAMDGLGFGSDGRFWGGEIFVADFTDTERIAYLDYIPMPGGAKAIREPWRMAAAYLQRTMGDDFLSLDLPFVHNLDRNAWKALRSMIATRTNSPETSSMGRLFDALSALLGLRSTINYEGQAAIEMEAIAECNIDNGYEFEIAGAGKVIRAESIIKHAVDDLLEGMQPSTVSAKFHLGVVDLIARIAYRVRDSHRLNRVVLSGGVFQNIFLLERVCRRLRLDGFEVFTHSRVPANDGGISLGQATIASALTAAGRI